MKTQIISGYHTSAQSREAEVLLKRGIRPRNAQSWVKTTCERLGDRARDGRLWWLSQTDPLLLRRSNRAPGGARLITHQILRGP